MTRLTRRSFVASLVAMPVAGSAWAGPVAFDSGWKTQRFSLFQQNQYGFQGQSLSVASDGSVSLTYRALDPALWNSRRASWSWAVSQGVPGTDLARKGGDDRNLALYFVFLPSEQASVGGNVRRLLTNSAVRVLVYVWGGAHPRRSVLSSPYLGERGKTIVLRPAGNGSASEEVDLAADHQRAFGLAPASLVGLAVSADSDDTDSQIRARISNLRLG